MSKMQRISVTIKDVAEDAGVSTATVSRVINNSPFVTEDLVLKVNQSISKLGYYPNAAARTLKTKKANAVGILVPDISNPYFMQIIKGIEDVMARLQFSLIMASSDENKDKEKKLLNLLSENRIDCLILATSGGNEGIIRQVNKTSIPVVLVDRLPSMLTDKVDSIIEDNHGSARELTEHILKQDVTSLGIIHGPMSASTAYQRAAGCRQAIDEAGREITIQEYYGDFSLESGAAGIESLSEGGLPQAIIALNNLMAVGAISRLLQSGYGAESDIIVGSYGAVETYPFLKKPFCYVAQEPRQLGRQVGEVVSRRLKDRNAPIVTKVIKQQLVTEDRE